MAEQPANLRRQAGRIAGLKIGDRVPRKMLLDAGKPRAREWDVHEDELADLVWKHQVAITVGNERDDSQGCAADPLHSLAPGDEPGREGHVLLQAQLFRQGDEGGPVLTVAQ